MDAIRTVGLTKNYKDLRAVDRLDLTVEQGELFALLGVNGAGKTTTIRMLTCLTPPSAGDAYLLGRSIRTDPAAVKRMIAVSPQETAVAPNLTVGENLELIAGVYGSSRTDAIPAVTGRLKLQSVFRKRAGTLSGGWQRRLSLAMALIAEPRLLFLDEPTLGLDVLSRSELWDLIRNLKGGTTIVLTTHYMEEAEALADRVGIMAGGRLLFCGTPDEAKAHAGADTLEHAFLSVVKEANA